RSARSVLLGLVDGEILERVSAVIGQQLQRVWPFHVHVGHVIRQREERAAFLPRHLLGTPVGIFGRDHGINIRTHLRIAKNFYRVPGSLYGLFKVFRDHARSLYRSVPIQTDYIAIPWETVGRAVPLQPQSGSSGDRLRIRVGPNSESVPRTPALWLRKN